MCTLSNLCFLVPPNQTLPPPPFETNLCSPNATQRTPLHTATQCTTRRNAHRNAMQRTSHHTATHNATHRAGPQLRRHLRRPALREPHRPRPPATPGRPRLRCGVHRRRRHHLDLVRLNNKQEKPTLLLRSSRSVVVRERACRPLVVFVAACSCHCGLVRLQSVYTID